MTYIKSIFDWIAAVAWPAAILTIALLYRKPIHSMLNHMGGIVGRAATQSVTLSVGSFKVDFESAVAAKKPQNVDEVIAAAADVAKSFIPQAAPVSNMPGWVISPYAPSAGYIDVRGFPAGTEVRDPYTNNIFRVPPQ
ncbi:MAG: hypothetical protein ACREIF_11270 [Chthoniobacterales bacterium]